MPQKLKITWDIVQKLLPETPWLPMGDKRSPIYRHVNVLLGSNGRMSNIPIQLWKDGEKILSANVDFFGSHYAFYHPALALLMRKLEHHNVTVDWNGASFHTNIIHPRSGISFDHDYTKAVLRGEGRELIDTFREISAEWKRDRHIPATLKRLEQQYDQFCAAILGASSIVTSDQVEKLLYVRENNRVSGFVPQGREL